jgi:cytochrome c5
MPINISQIRRPAARPARVTGGLLVGALALALGACGGGAPRDTTRASTTVPAYVTEPFTPEQHLVEQGAPLIVSDGCAACHLIASAHAVAPSFSSFAGHRVRLTDGRTVLVDERFVREGLLHPREHEIAGYDPTPMLAAVARLHFAEHPRRVAALAAFIEQVGPEPE